MEACWIELSLTSCDGEEGLNSQLQAALALWGSLRDLNSLVFLPPSWIPILPSSARIQWNSPHFVPRSLLLYAPLPIYWWVHRLASTAAYRGAFCTPYRLQPGQTIARVMHHTAPLTLIISGNQREQIFLFLIPSSTAQPCLPLHSSGPSSPLGWICQRCPNMITTWRRCLVSGTLSLSPSAPPLRSCNRPAAWPSLQPPLQPVSHGEGGNGNVCRWVAGCWIHPNCFLAARGGVIYCEKG